MVAGPITVKFDVTFAWWLRPWLQMVALTSRLTGIEPDWDKIGAMFERALIIQVL